MTGDQPRFRRFPRAPTAARCRRSIPTRASCRRPRTPPSARVRCDRAAGRRARRSRSTTARRSCRRRRTRRANRPGRSPARRGDSSGRRTCAGPSRVDVDHADGTHEVADDERSTIATEHQRPVTARRRRVLLQQLVIGDRPDAQRRVVGRGRQAARHPARTPGRSRCSHAAGTCAGSRRRTGRRATP